MKKLLLLFMLIMLPLVYAQDAGDTSILFLQNGTVNGQPVTGQTCCFPGDRIITVSPGQVISGAVTLDIHNAWPTTISAPLIGTPSWGNAQTSYRTYGNATSGDATVQLNWVAPSTPEVYYILFAFRAEIDGGDVASMTNWAANPERWGDGNDVAQWSESMINTANMDGRVPAQVYFQNGMQQRNVPATSLTVHVVAPGSAGVTLDDEFSVDHNVIPECNTDFPVHEFVWEFGDGTTYTKNRESIFCPDHWSNTQCTTHRDNYMASSDWNRYHHSYLNDGTFTITCTAHGDNISATGSMTVDVFSDASAQEVAAVVSDSPGYYGPYIFRKVVEQLSGSTYRIGGYSLGLPRDENNNGQIGYWVFSLPFYSHLTSTHDSIMTVTFPEPGTYDFFADAGGHYWEQSPARLRWGLDFTGCSNPRTRCFGASSSMNVTIPDLGTRLQFGIMVRNLGNRTYELSCQSYASDAGLSGRIDTGDGSWLTYNGNEWVRHTFSSTGTFALTCYQSLGSGLDKLYYYTLDVTDVSGECGNAVVEGTEMCDDGNLLDGDSCSSSCRFDDRGANSTLLFEGGSINSVALVHPHYTAFPGETLDVQITAHKNVSWLEGRVVLVAIPSWGDPAATYQYISDIPLGAINSRSTSTFRVTAPTQEGEYHLFLAMFEADTPDYIASMTDDDATDVPVWGDGNDIALWSSEKISQTRNMGRAIGDLWVGNQFIDAHVPALAITITVQNNPVNASGIVVLNEFSAHHNVLLQCNPGFEATRYEWKFGDDTTMVKDLSQYEGNPSTLSRAFHTFPGNGTYTVECSAFGESKSIHLILKDIHIQTPATAEEIANSNSGAVVRTRIFSDNSMHMNVECDVIGVPKPSSVFSWQWQPEDPEDRYFDSLFLNLSGPFTFSGRFQVAFPGDYSGRCYGGTYEREASHEYQNTGRFSGWECSGDSHDGYPRCTSNTADTVFFVQPDSHILYGTHVQKLDENSYSAICHLPPYTDVPIDWSGDIIASGQEGEPLFFQTQNASIELHCNYGNPTFSAAHAVRVNLHDVFDLTALTEPQTCFNKISELEVSCKTGSKTSDTLSGNCRTVQCTADFGSVSAQACEKTDTQGKYFEIYRKSASGIQPEVCFGEDCLRSGWGYERGEYFPICTASMCGNGVVQSGEQCDDGNTASGDGCSSTCQSESITPVCGNGVLQSGEQCDDGNTLSGDGCSSSCQTETQQCHIGIGTIPATCTGGTITQNTLSGTCRTIVCEQAGNSIKVFACDKPDSGTKQYFEMYRQVASGTVPKICIGETCIQSEGYKRSAQNYPICSGSSSICGNGQVESGEQCDDGNTQSGDGCSSTCQFEQQEPMCGNGAVEFGEQCDDGNTVNNDGCSSTCQTETSSASVDLRIKPWYPQGRNYIFICDESGYTATSYNWIFGDGHKQTTSVDNVYHTYANAGGYTVQCTATGSVSRSDTLAINVS